MMDGNKKEWGKRRVIKALGRKREMKRDGWVDGGRRLVHTARA